jgi:hypothetical protein
VALSRTPFCKSQQLPKRFVISVNQLDHCLDDYCQIYPQRPKQLPIKRPIYSAPMITGAYAFQMGQIEVQFRVAHQLKRGAIIEILGYAWV